jgi:hypothetical protein
LPAIKNLAFFGALTILRRYGAKSVTVPGRKSVIRLFGSIQAVHNLGEFTFHMLYVCPDPGALSCAQRQMRNV